MSTLVETSLAQLLIGPTKDEIENSTETYPDAKIAALFKRISDERMVVKSDLAIAGPAIAPLDFQSDEFARAIIKHSA
jgi:hypothetical protein